MESREANKQAKKKTSKKMNKRWWSRGTNVGLDRMSITSLCLRMDETLARKTHAWTSKQACKDAYKANGWHKQAQHRMEWKRGKVCMKQPESWRCLPSGYTQKRPLGRRM